MVYSFQGLLHTDRWKEFREQVFERDGGQCTQCGSVASLVCHHLSYENFFVSELVTTLCQSCHVRTHGIQHDPQPEPPLESTYSLHLDARRRLILPQAVLGCLGRNLQLYAFDMTALLHAKWTPLEDIVKSTELLLQTLKHELEMQQKTAT